jgi:hypothetical protein
MHSLHEQYTACRGIILSKISVKKRIEGRNKEIDLHESKDEHAKEEAISNT